MENEKHEEREEHKEHKEHWNLLEIPKNFRELVKFKLEVTRRKSDMMHFQGLNFRSDVTDNMKYHLKHLESKGIQLYGFMNNPLQGFFSIYHHYYNHLNTIDKEFFDDKFFVENSDLVIKNPEIFFHAFISKSWWKTFLELHKEYENAIETFEIEKRKIYDYAQAYFRVEKLNNQGFYTDGELTYYFSEDPNSSGDLLIACGYVENGIMFYNSTFFSFFSESTQIKNFRKIAKYDEYAFEGEKKLFEYLLSQNLI